MMPALLSWGSFGCGVWGVPWGRGRNDALGTLNVPFWDVLDIPFLELPFWRHLGCLWHPSSFLKLSPKPGIL